jgi:murein L,D-transpeptidase YafK
MRALLPLIALASMGAIEPVDEVLIDKSDRTLELLNDGAVIRTFHDIKLGDSPEGHKQFQGDEKTPEGIYEIDGSNPQSRYFLSLRISYPNDEDRAYAASFGRSPGGDIFIHGQPNGSPVERLDWDWTDGCIALSNEDMRFVWSHVSEGTRVIIRP